MKNFHILLIEDDPEDAELTLLGIRQSSKETTSTVLSSGVNVMSYLLGEEKYQETTSPGLIFLDLNLPGLSGKEILLKIRSLEQFHHIPIVIVTNSLNQVDQEECKQLGANDFLSKNSDIQKFLTNIQKIHDNYKTEALD